MRRTLLPVLIATCGLAAAPALASRAPTSHERAAIAAAIRNEVHNSAAIGKEPKTISVTDVHVSSVSAKWATAHVRASTLFGGTNIALVQLLPAKGGRRSGASTRSASRRWTARRPPPPCARTSACTAPERARA